MKLLLVTFDPPRGSGGIEGRTMAYTREFLNSSVRIEVAALSSGQEQFVEPYLGTRLVRLSSSILKAPGSFSSLIRMLSQTSLDSVFMLSGGATPTGILLLAYSRITRRRTAVFFYGRDLLQAKRKAVGRVLIPFAILLSNRVATNSRYTANLLPFGFGDRASIIYPGVDISNSSALKGTSVASGGARVLFVGRLVHRKGADVLLEAFSRILPSFPGARLDIVGDGPEMSRLLEHADRLGLGNSVSFHGALYGRQLWEMYAQATILALPSRLTRDDAEGFGTVFLEAAVLGVPSVATRTGGIPEAVIDGVTGKLVESEDIAGLAEAIRSLLSDPKELERLGDNARKRALQFTWQASARRVIQLFGKSQGTGPIPSTSAHLADQTKAPITPNQRA